MSVLGRSFIDINLFDLIKMVEKEMDEYNRRKLSLLPKNTLWHRKMLAIYMCRLAFLNALSNVLLHALLNALLNALLKALLYALLNALLVRPRMR